MSASPEFDGKTVIITGGARNIGRELTRLFVAQGASVVVNSRSARPELQETVELAMNFAAHGGKAVACVADITRGEDVARLVETTVHQFGRLDILINNAVQHANKAFMQLTFDEWRGTMSVALDGAFRNIRRDLNQSAFSFLPMSASRSSR